MLSGKSFTSKFQTNFCLYKNKTASTTAHLCRSCQYLVSVSLMPPHTNSPWPVNALLFRFILEWLWCLGLLTVIYLHAVQFHIIDQLDFTYSTPFSHCYSIDITCVGYRLNVSTFQSTFPHSCAKPIVNMKKKLLVILFALPIWLLTILRSAVDVSHLIERHLWQKGAPPFWHF